MWLLWFPWSYSTYSLQRKNGHMVVNHHVSFCKAWNPEFPNIFLSRQPSKFFRSRLFFTSLQTPISYSLLSTVDHPQQFPSVSAPGFPKQSSNLNMKPQSEQQVLPFLPHSFLTMNFWLTLLINIATSGLAGGPSTLQRQRWGSECKFANVFFSL